MYYLIFFLDKMLPAIFDRSHAWAHTTMIMCWSQLLTICGCIPWAPLRLQDKNHLSAIHGYVYPEFSMNTSCF